MEGAAVQQKMGAGFLKEGCTYVRSIECDFKSHLANAARGTLRNQTGCPCFFTCWCSRLRLFFNILRSKDQQPFQPRMGKWYPTRHSVFSRTITMSTLRPDVPST